MTGRVQSDLGRHIIVQVIMQTAAHITAHIHAQISRSARNIQASRVA